MDQLVSCDRHSLRNVDHFLLQPDLHGGHEFIVIEQRLKYRWCLGTNAVSIDHWHLRYVFVPSSHTILPSLRPPDSLSEALLGVCKFGHVDVLLSHTAHEKYTARVQKSQTKRQLLLYGFYALSGHICALKASQ